MTMIIKKRLVGTHGIMVIILGNKLGGPSSNPGQGCL